MPSPREIDEALFYLREALNDLKEHNTGLQGDYYGEQYEAPNRIEESIKQAIEFLGGNDE